MAFSTVTSKFSFFSRSKGKTKTSFGFFVLDLTFSKTFKKTTIKLGIQDLLNAKYQFYEDSNRDEKISKDIDNATSVFKKGTLFSLNLTHNF